MSLNRKPLILLASYGPVIRANLRLSYEEKAIGFNLWKESYGASTSEFSHGLHYVP